MGMGMGGRRARETGGKCRLFVRYRVQGVFCTQGYVSSCSLNRVSDWRVNYLFGTLASDTFYVYFQQSLRPQTQRGSVFETVFPAPLMLIEIATTLQVTFVGKAADSCDGPLYRLPLSRNLR
jgi:hypothetical protein